MHHYMGKLRRRPSLIRNALVLRHLGEHNAVEEMGRAIAEVIAKERDVTYDLKPTPDDPTAVGTSDRADAMIAAMSSCQLQAKR
jgi:isocitrate dehydrogenase (NAD+)